MKSLIVGMGEVGAALERVLSPFVEVHTKDVEDKPVPEKVDVMHVCLNFYALGGDEFLRIVGEYAGKCSPGAIDVCSTVPPGTTRAVGANAVHSTTRGLHPRLDDGLREIVKHVGGPLAQKVAAYYRRAGVPTHAHARPETTEAAHLLNNIAYGVNLMLADEMARLCRMWGVDYAESVMRYTQTNNAGFRRLDHESKCRMVLTPPNGGIGGHCVVQAAQCVSPIAENRGVRSPLVDLLAKYNGG